MRSVHVLVHYGRAQAECDAARVEQIAAEAAARARASGATERAARGAARAAQQNVLQELQRAHEHDGDGLASGAGRARRDAAAARRAAAAAVADEPVAGAADVRRRAAHGAAIDTAAALASVKSAANERRAADGAGGAQQQGGDADDDDDMSGSPRSPFRFVDRGKASPTQRVGNVDLLADPVVLTCAEMFEKLRASGGVNDGRFVDNHGVFRLAEDVIGGEDLQKEMRRQRRRRGSRNGRGGGKQSNLIVTALKGVSNRLLEKTGNVDFFCLSLAQR